MWFQYLIQLRSLSTSTDIYSSIDNECNILSTPFPLLGNNLQLLGIVFFFLILKQELKTFVSKYLITFYMSLHDFVIPGCGILSNLNNFPVPRVGNLTKKLQKIQMLHLCPYTPPPHLRLNINTCIIAILELCYGITSPCCKVLFITWFNMTYTFIT